MGNLFGLLGGPIKDFVGAVSGLIDNVSTTSEEKLEKQRQLLEIERGFQAKVVLAETEWVKAQASVITAEAQSQSWLTRSWRPLTMVAFVFFIGMIVWTGGFINGRQLSESFILRILDIIEIGLGGYVVGRSVEKIAPPIASLFVKKK